jgi:hypothetical protein
MDECDFLGEHVVETAAGSVRLSVAAHADGAVSVVAWLMLTGQRVGLIRRAAHGHAGHEELLDDTLASPDLLVAMHGSLAAALGPIAASPPEEAQLVHSGVVTPTELSDLLGWQWLLSELGEYHSVGELAADAGLVHPVPRPVGARRGR